MFKRLVDGEKRKLKKRSFNFWTRKFIMQLNAESYWGVNITITSLNIPTLF